MKTIVQVISESLLEAPKFKDGKNLPFKVKYAEKVNIGNKVGCLILLPQSDGFACAFFDPSEYDSDAKFIYLKDTTNIIPIYKNLLSPGRAKKTSTLGPDGEMHYDVENIKTEMPKKYIKDIVDKSASQVFKIYPSDILYMIKNGNKPKGLWKNFKEDSIEKSQIDQTSFTICVDGQFCSDDVREYTLVPNENFNIGNSDALVVIDPNSLESNNSNFKLDYIFEGFTNRVLFGVSNRFSKYEGGKINICKFEKFENNTLYLTTSNNIKIAQEEARHQIVE